VSVVSSDQIEKVSGSGSPTPLLRTVLLVQQFDTCTETIIYAGEGDTADQSFHVAANLSSATLTTSVPVTDSILHQTTIFQVELTWKATGKAEATRFTETFTDKGLGIKIKTKSNSTQAPAVATGTVIGSAANVAPEPSDSATIQKVNDGTHSVEKSP